MTSKDLQRQELERIVELLGSGTRSGRLLGFIGAKFFQQQEDQLTEFTIATQVFGRSEKSFDSTEDAVVRVEAHRLRKKLRDLYEKRGGVGDLQISLPAGSYVPKFDIAPADHPRAPVVEEVVGSRRVPKSVWYAASAAALICAAIVGASWNDADRDGSASQKSRAVPGAGASAGTGKLTEVHLMAGYGGSEVIDNSGVRWTPDRFYSGGNSWPRTGGFVRGTSRQFLFANWRSGEFGYDIPLESGVYELRLFFVSWQKVGEEKIAGFHVALDGEPLLSAYDANVSAHGVDVADERVFRGITPGEDGFVHLRFSNQIATPSVNAIEIVPGISGKQNPIRIITQPNSFVDHKGQRWRADDYFLNGFRATERPTVSGTDDPELFTAERFGHFSYAIPVDTRGRYTVILHFAEFYFGPQSPGKGGVGSRVFNVFCNGRALVENFDIFKEGGSLKLVSKTFSGIKPSAQGKINLTFEPVVNNATVSAIEVLDESS